MLPVRTWDNDLATMVAKTRVTCLREFSRSPSGSSQEEDRSHKDIFADRFDWKLLKLKAGRGPSVGLPANMVR